MGRANSIRRNTAFDLTQAKYTTPQTRLEANRWLGYATFGAATAPTDIAASTKTAVVPISGEVDEATDLMSIGYAAWVNAQLTNTSIPSLFDNQNQFGSLTFETKTDAIRAWFYTEAIHGKAQIRLKLAWALSQIFVVNAGVDGVGRYRKLYDNLVKATLSLNNSSFRTLLDDVTYSPAMATMLTYINNKKEDIPTNRHPDENYAREILQLFTIGLVQLNLDGTPIKSTEGVPIETYTSTDVSELSKVFTGLGGNGGDPNFLDLTETQDDHSTSTKTLLAYPGGSPLVIPAQLAGAVGLEYPADSDGYVISGVTANTFQVTLSIPSPNAKSNAPFSYRTTSNFLAARVDGTVSVANNGTVATITKTAHGLTNGTNIWSYGNIQESIKIALDYIFNHPNVPPFISKALIKFFVTSNPSPQYVKRVAEKFVNNGNGVRGDLSAVVKAILLDREAIAPIGINPNNHGRYTSVFDRYIRVARAFRSDQVHVLKNDNGQSGLPEKSSRNFVATYPYFTKPRTIKDYLACGFYFNNTMQPQQSASVFNFFRPGYTPPGTLLGDIAKTSPEMQINTVDLQITWANSVASLCETLKQYLSSPGNFGGGGLLDPRDNQSLFGFEFNPHPSGHTVTGVSGVTITFNGTINNALTSTSGVIFKGRSRSTGEIYDFLTNPPTGTGVQTFNANIINSFGNATITNGQIFDFMPLAILSHSSFPTTKALNNTNGLIGIEVSPVNVLFHKVAALIPNTVGIPTLGELNPAIDYLESILMTRPISSGVRNLMVQAGQIPITIDTPYLDGNAAFQNHWLNCTIGYAQKRARHMTAVLLISPEFSVLR